VVDKTPQQVKQILAEAEAEAEAEIPLLLIPVVVAGLEVL
jgi:hypothetical protein